MKRLFIGVHFDKEMNNYFKSTQLRVEKYCERANYTSYDNFHLTLKFLGMMEESSILAIIDVIKNLRATPVPVLFDHIGFFNKKGRYVIYMGTKPEVTLTELALKLNEELVKKGLVEYRLEDFSYTPHITLCRNARILVHPIDLSKGIEIKYHARISNITLFESVNIDGKLMYKPIFSRELI